jgi:Mn-dependent DtxR family transcriptional regulator
MIIIQTIPHKEQRYETCGDYWRDKKGDLQIRVSDTGNTNMNFLIAVHELIEVFLTEDRGIKEPLIKAFDEKFEAERLKGIHRIDDDPGDKFDAPYRKEHFFATNIERMLCAELGVNWQEYDNTVMSL